MGCTELDSSTGKTKHTFLKGYKKDQMVGGPLQSFHSRFGLRFAWCNVGDLCNDAQGWYYDYGTTKFREVTSKKEQCEIKLVPEWGCDSHSQAGSTRECTYGTCVADDISSSSSYREKIKSDAELEKMRTKYHNYCPKSKSNNIISCPKDIIKKTNNPKVKWLNEYFKKIAKKSKK